MNKKLTSEIYWDATLYFQVIVDMTFGAGGHTKALLKECPGIRVFGLDRDPLAHNLATQLASQQ